MTNTHILTIDLEDYFHLNGLGIDIEKYSDYTSRIRLSTDFLLNCLSKYNSKATFFVLGCIADKYPDIIKKISSSGHEIASHGYYHRLLYNISYKEALEDIKRSKNIIESIIGNKIIGFRAPSWSITKNNAHLLNEIKKIGFKYDSSLFPFKTWLYGSSKFPDYIRKLPSGLIEIPPTISRIGALKIPFSGGIYFRIIPNNIIYKAIKRTEKMKRPCIFYFHPWEFDPEQPRIDSSFIYKFIHYYGLKRMKKRFSDLLCRYRFISISEYLTVMGSDLLPISSLPYCS